MGIPHMITFLQPYAEAVPLSGQDIVVDGPAFAYHIYHICLGGRLDAKGAFDATPSYAEIGHTALRWLDGLRKKDGTIKKVYFDGFLPPAKLDTRMQRLVSLTNRMTNYYHSNPTIALRTSNTFCVDSVFSQAKVRHATTLLPPLPFLVPCVLDALRSSVHYRDITTVVPGEADLYCANYLVHHGGIVFTADSDLLVHNLGAEGSVCFFKDVQQDSAMPVALQVNLYHPTTVAKRLGLPIGLLPLAFEMSMDPHGSFPKLLSQAKISDSIRKHGDTYEAFQKEYNTPPNELPVPKDLPIVAVLQSLDARISEYVLQYPCFLEAASKVQITQRSTPSPQIFLPFLLDCPGRTSAWEVSASVRQLAYGLMSIVVPETQRKLTVFEHKRQQSTSKGREFQLPTLEQIPEACEALVALLVKLKAKLPSTSASDFWIAVAIYQDMDWAHTNAKTPLSSGPIEHNSRMGDSMSSWDLIHFVALTESSYYSFRILKQLISVLVVSCPRDTYSSSILLLQQELESLPLLDQLKNTRQASAIIEFARDVGIGNTARDILGVKKQSVNPTRKKRKRERVSTQVVNSKWKSNNLFDALEPE